MPQRDVDSPKASGQHTFKADTSPLVNLRSDTIQQQQLQLMANNSQQVQQLKAYQSMADTHLASQVSSIQFSTGSYFSNSKPVVQQKENKTGLPDALKSGVEHLSGLSLSDVNVHYNSSKPAQLNAHAYAQGTSIHVAPGQEKHLPHEAWHVVQQKQGRVKPTQQLKEKVAINDDKALETEADVMGAKALAASSASVQRVVNTTTLASSVNEVAQLEKTVSGHGGLRKDAHGAHVPYTVPVGKTLVLSAPPGATLGDISLTLNVTTTPNLATMRSLIKVSTTTEIWSNLAVVAIIEANATIPKTALQATLLTNLINGTSTYGGLSGPHKNSLNALEKRAEFEAWADGYVRPNTFVELVAGTAMTDMDITPFEPALRSHGSSAQTDYVNAPTTLSAYVGATADNRIIINACSHSTTGPYTGFQIDRA